MRHIDLKKWTRACKFKPKTHNYFVAFVGLGTGHVDSCGHRRNSNCVYFFFFLHSSSIAQGKSRRGMLGDVALSTFLLNFLTATTGPGSCSLDHHRKLLTFSPLERFTVRLDTKLIHFWYSLSFIQKPLQNSLYLQNLITGVTQTLTHVSQITNLSLFEWTT